jgi:hypothetical protein
VVPEVPLAAAASNLALLASLEPTELVAGGLAVVVDVAARPLLCDLSPPVPGPGAGSSFARSDCPGVNGSLDYYRAGTADGVLRPGPRRHVRGPPS